MSKKPDLVRDVREATRCPSTYEGIKCHMTVGHSGDHAGVSAGPKLIHWHTEDANDSNQDHVPAKEPKA